MPAGENSSRRPHVPFALIEPASYVEPLDLEKIFGRRAPLQVDLGCGDGTFLCALAHQLPEKNFLGIERLLGRANSTARKIGPSRTGDKICNARVLRMENFYAVRYLLPPGSVDKFYLLFPDPWPKRRHQRRRVVNEDFLGAIHDALIDNGTLHIATDQRDYFEQIEQMARLAQFRVATPATSETLPATKFEKEFLKKGVPIYRVELRRISPVR